MSSRRPHNQPSRGGVFAVPPSTLGRKRPSEAQASPAKRQRRDLAPPNLVRPSPIVKVHVRENEESEYTTFPVHLNHICHYSPFFKAAFHGRFEEGEKKEIQLQETDHRVFGIFVNWLYTQKIHTEEGLLPDCSSLVGLWILADRFLVPKLQNQALLSLNAARIRDKIFTSKLYRPIYDGTCPGSPLRQYLIDYCVNSTFEIMSPDAYPHELLIDIIQHTRAEKAILTGRKTCRWDVSVDVLEREYFVDEDVENPMDHRYDLSFEIDTRNAEEISALEPTMEGGANEIAEAVNTDASARDLDSSGVGKVVSTQE